MHFSSAAVLLAGAAQLASAAPTSLNPRLVLQMIPPKGNEWEETWQPPTDFDTDSCYYTSAIDPNGKTNDGVPINIFDGFTKYCRDADRLNSNNVYSRSRCNNNVCAVMYEYYFEKDQADAGFGHRHDWENIVVFIQKDNKKVVGVAPTCHGKYDGARGANGLDGVLFDGNRVKMVYHRDGPGTHCWRFADGKDDGKQENARGTWILGNVLGWDFWPSESLRKALYDKFPGGVAPKLWDAGNSFSNNLKTAAEKAGVKGFDAFHDE